MYVKCVIQQIILIIIKPNPLCVTLLEFFAIVADYNTRKGTPLYMYFVLP